MGLVAAGSTYTKVRHDTPHSFTSLSASSPSLTHSLAAATAAATGVGYFAVIVPVIIINTGFLAAAASIAFNIVYILLIVVPLVVFACLTRNAGKGSRAKQRVPRSSSRRAMMPGDSTQKEESDEYGVGVELRPNPAHKERLRFAARSGAVD